MTVRSLGAATALALAVVLVGACGSDPTAVRLTVEYDDSWNLDELELAINEASNPAAEQPREQSDVAPELYLLVPDDWDGRELRLQLWGLRRNENRAYGEVEVRVQGSAEVAATVILSVLPCGDWCQPGEVTCQGDAVVTCGQQDDDTCLEWGEPVACGDEAPFCSLGRCQASCTDECSDDDVRCAGPGAVQTCGQADSDECKDWLPAVDCGDGQTCSQGSCVAACTDECKEGETECLNDGVITCADRNADGCFEWGPAVMCPTNQSCSSGVCADECVDECSEATCNGDVFAQCGQFDSDPCLDLGAGVSCIPADPCFEGACTPEGCISAPRVCDSPPDAVCVDDRLLRRYESTGTCGEGVCDYGFEDVECDNGCEDGACAGCENECEGPECDGNVFIDCGDFDADSCLDRAEPETCDTGDACRPGLCTANGCETAPIVCDEPPAPECVEKEVLRRYRDTGTCSGGACTYEFEDEKCENGCQDGTCLDTVGRADLIFIGLPTVGVDVRVSNGQRLLPRQIWSNAGQNGSDEVVRVRFADVDGDGDSDMIYVWLLGAEVRRSSGRGFGQPEEWTTGDRVNQDGDVPRYHYADVNGDGLADQIYVGLRGSGRGGVEVSLSGGARFGSPVTWSTAGASDRAEAARFHFADVDGDNRADMIYVGNDERVAGAGIFVRRSTGTSFGGEEQWAKAGSSQDIDVARHFFGDADGDGKVDHIFVGSEEGFSGAGVFVGSSTGDSFDSRERWLPSGTRDLMARYRFADVTGDGKVDHIVVSTPGRNGGIRVRASNGSRFGEREQWSQLGTSDTSDAIRFYFADVTGPRPSED